MSVEMSKTQPLQQVQQAPSTVRLPRVNLLPPEIARERDFRKTRLILAGSTALVVVLLAGGYAASAISANNAQDDLAAQDAIAATLAKEEAKYAEVPKVIAEVGRAQDARALGMATDVLLAPQVDQIARSLPPNVWFQSIAITVPAGAGATPQIDAPLATPGTIGNVQVTGAGFTQTNTAQFLEALATQPGYVDPFFTASARSDINGKVVVNHTASSQLTPDVFSHRYDKKAN